MPLSYGGNIRSLEDAKKILQYKDSDDVVFDYTL